MLARMAACMLTALLLLQLAGCGERYARPVLPATYTVRSGDTVYSIAWRHGLEYQKLARWNGLPADYRIYPGQVLRLYPAGEQPGRAAGASRPAPAARAAAPSPASVPASQRVAAWVWPAVGEAQARAGAPGLLIAGEEGQPVNAAAPGRVVYTGSGLRGFGQLVIIKHSEAYLSAYGHNSILAVKEGEQVTAGQTIARMGLGPGAQPALYFEIRLNGHPVDPLRYLPRR
jgi:lipoprotein NlpD